jgi:hypothetical protein
MLKLTRTILLTASCLVAILMSSLEARAAIIEVNTNLDEDNCGSTTLSLREAILIAQGQMAAANESKVYQIIDQTGLIIDPIPLPTIPNGCKSAPKGMLFYGINHQPGTPPFDTIRFINGLSTIFLNSSLYPLSMIWQGGEINGKAPNGTNIVIDGSNMAGAVSGITLGDNRYNLLNLEIRNFGGDGVVMDGTDNSVLRGLKIHHNGGHGIHVVSTNSLYGNPQNNEIGGTGSDQGNIIHSNGGDGINITGNTAYDRAFQNIRILKNVIGTADGIAASPNGGNGITLVNTWGVTVGDPSGLTKNTISGNAHDGVQISGAEAVSNAVFRNNIGTDINGNARLGNGWSGVALLGDAGHNVDHVNRFENRIGKPGYPNLISANANGVYFGGTNTSHNFVQSNLIGTGNGGNTDLGNTSQGVYFHDGTFDNLIGGTGAGEGNLIAFNGFAGIIATDGIRNSFKRNQIFSNVYLGIDLAPSSLSGVTPNDSNDGDSGPNGLQNFPAISYVNPQSGSVTISGSLNSTPNQSFDLEFFGNSAQDFTGYGEGRNFLGTAKVTTNASGNAVFSNLNFTATPSTVGSWITATATDSNGNTSEFSQSVKAGITLTYNGNGNTGGIVPIDTNGYSDGAAVTVVGNPGGLSKTGFNFSGWNDASTGLGVNYVAGSSFWLSSLTNTLYANWTSVNSQLIQLTTSAGGLSPAFNSATLAYTVAIPNVNTFVTVTPTSADPKATITVSGVSVASSAASPKIGIPVGTRAIPISVSSSGNETNYSITVTRANAVPNAPTISKVKAGIGKATVSFTPANAGGLATSFRATCSADGETPLEASGTLSELVVSPLSPGITYQCSVVAINGLGTSAPSAPVSVASRIDLTPILMLLLD